MRARPILLAFSLVVFTAVVAGAGTLALMHLPLTTSYVVAALSLCGLVKLSEEQIKGRLSRVREALKLTGYTQKSAALTLGMDEGDFCRMLNGERKYDDVRMEALGPEFRRNEALVTLREFGLPELVRTAVKVASVLQDDRRTA